MVEFSIFLLYGSLDVANATYCCQLIVATSDDFFNLRVKNYNDIIIMMTWNNMMLIMGLQQFKRSQGLIQSFLLKVYIIYFTLIMNSANTGILSLWMNSITTWVPALLQSSMPYMGLLLAFNLLNVLLVLLKEAKWGPKTLILSKEIDRHLQKEIQNLMKSWILLPFFLSLLCTPE